MTADHTLEERSGSPLTIFVVPSWYPSQTTPILGVFIEDQVRALARRRPIWRLAVSVWGQGETGIKLRRPITSLARAVWHTHAGRSERALADNARVYVEPVLHWTPRLFTGRFEAIARANRGNFVRAAIDLGSPDVIHAHGTFPAGLVAMTLAAEFDVPYVITEHSGEALQARIERSALGRRAFRDALEHASARIAVSQALARRLADSYVPPTDIIPNVVDEDFFDLTGPAPRAQGPSRVFTLAQLVDGKGIDILLAAAERSQAVGFPLSLRIGGDGPRRDDWERLAHRLGVSESVEFLGRLEREAVREELNACSCFVLPSESESFSVVCIEALACGRPIVATHSGGPEEIVTDANGVLVPTRDVDALAAGLRSVLSRDYDHKAIRDDAVRRFGTEALASAIETVYRRITSPGI